MTCCARASHPGHDPMISYGSNQGTRIPCSRRHKPMISVGDGGSARTRTWDQGIMSPILLSLHGVQGLPAFGIALYIKDAGAECGRDPMTRHAAREQSLEGAPESSGYVLFIPDCGGQGHERGHISDRLSESCFEKKTH